MAKSKEKKFCAGCNRTKSIDDFYGSLNIEKYPDKHLNLCKECSTMYVDNWKSETYLPILKEADVPYIPEEWDKLLASYAKDRSKVTGLTIVGRYLGKMRLSQYKDFRWKDTEFLQKRSEKMIEEAMKRQGYGAAEITQVLDDNKVFIPEEDALKLPELTQLKEENNIVDQPAMVISLGNGSAIMAPPPEEDEDDLAGDLTEEDKKMLRIKWGKTYKADEWVRLEQLYQEMMESYDVQGAGHEDILKLACKTSLKSNQLIDIGDVDGAQKMVKMYDSLMKSGKFTAAQNKADEGEFLSSISELTLLCEKEGFIARFYTDGPKDRVDETIMDLQQYAHDLIVEEMNLGNLIENAIKEMQRQEEKEEDEDIDEDDLTLEALDELKDEDFEEFNEFEEDEELAQEELLKHLQEEE